MNNTKVITKIIRMNYTNLFTPKKSIDSEEARYSLSILIPKEDYITINKINQAIYQAKEKGLQQWGIAPEEIKSPLRDGDKEKSHPAYEKQMFLNATSKYKPGIVDKDREEITDETQIYPGCYGRVSIKFFPFMKNGVYGIGCSLDNVQKLADGELISLRATAEEDFAQDIQWDVL